MKSDQINNHILVTKGLLLLSFLIVFLSSCVYQSDFPIDKTVVCDAEKVTERGDEFIAVDGESDFFKGGNFRSKLQARSGEYSVLTIPKKRAFALAYEINGIEPNAYLEVSVWRKSKDGKGNLVVAADNTDALYKALNVPTYTTNDGWEKLDMEVFIPPNFDGSKIKIYVWNNGSDTVYFDDLTISRKAAKTYPDFDYQNGIDIVIDTSDYLKIMKKRREAFNNGILQTSDNDWIKGIVVDNDIAKKAKLRLKGDWLDHLWGDKWSYRVKMRKQNTFNRLRTFSLQTPAARNYLLEWLTHKLYHKYDVLTTRYGFIPLSFNGSPRGLYVWEEHFVKQLPEWNLRREGPIVKFTEDAFWQIQKQNIHTKGWPNFPYYQASEIVPFGQNRTLGSPTLSSQFADARKLMEQYKYQTKPASEIFDADKLARYYAMLDLTHARHGMTWHNQRMYYNPVICKLEPIAFDGYTDHEEADFSINDNMAYKAFTCYENMVPQDRLILQLFGDEKFLGLYLKYLEEYSNEQLINEFLAGKQNEIDSINSMLVKEFPKYHYKEDFLIRSAEGIRNYLPELKRVIAERLQKGELVIEQTDEIYSDTSLFQNTPEYFVKAYIEDTIGSELKLKVLNYYSREITLIGSGFNEELMTGFFDADIKLDPFYKVASESEASIDTTESSLFFTVAHSDQIFAIPVIPWEYPNGITSQQELMAKVDMSNPLFDRIDGEEIHIRTGATTVGQPVIIPDGYKVNFYPGTEIDIVNKAMIISYSPVYMKGTSDNPVIIRSSDFTGNGFTVLQANGESSVDNVVFENLNTLDYKTWLLTGAVTFYESDVTISNTRFFRNQCEDALNIIRSDFTVKDCEFDYIFSDAFDADFCIGEIHKTKYTNIGNDAMDFSGSLITIRDSEVIGANDKGISGGEESTVYVFNTDITRANIGLASKDLSVVKVDNSKVTTCNYGVVLLQKKPEYGPSSMYLTNSSITDTKTELLIEKGAVVVKDGVEIHGEELNLSEEFY